MKRAELESLLERIAQGDEDALEELMEELENEGPATRQLFLDALERGDTQDVWNAIVLTLADDPYAPEAAAPSEPASRVPAHLLEEVRDASDRGTRLAAIRQLAGYADPDTVDPLVDVLGDDRLVANAATEALVEIGPPAVPALNETLSSRNSQVRWHAAKALSEIADPRATRPLINVLDDENSGVRWLAAEGLVAIGPQVVGPLLEELANRSVGARFRQSTYHVLNKVAADSEENEAWLRSLAQRVRRTPREDLPVLARQALSEWQ